MTDYELRKDLMLLDAQAERIEFDIKEMRKRISAVLKRCND